MDKHAALLYRNIDNECHPHGATPPKPEIPAVLRFPWEIKEWDPINEPYIPRGNPPIASASDHK